MICVATAFWASATYPPGARREAGSEGYAEKYRAVVDEGYLKDEPVGRRWDKVEAFSFTHRTKVFADGTVRKIKA